MVQLTFLSITLLNPPSPKSAESRSPKFVKSHLLVLLFVMTFVINIYVIIHLLNYHSIETVNLPRITTALIVLHTVMVNLIMLKNSWKMAGLIPHFLNLSLWIDLTI